MIFSESTNLIFQQKQNNLFLNRCFDLPIRQTKSWKHLVKMQSWFIDPQPFTKPNLIYTHVFNQPNNFQEPNYNWLHSQTSNFENDSSG